MAFTHSKNQRIVIDAADATGIGRMARTRLMRDTAECTTFEDDDRTYVGGLRDGTFSMECVFKGERAATEVVIDDMGLAEPTHLITHAPEGLAVGNTVFLMESIETELLLGGDTRSVIFLNLVFQTSGGVTVGTSLGDPFA